MRSLILAAVGAVAFTGTAFAADIDGYWRSEEGKEGGCIVVKMMDDGGTLSGTIHAVLESENQSIVGELQTKEFIEESAGSYRKGKVWAPDEDKWYVGKIDIENSDTITLAGCVLGGAICRGQTWTRVSASEKSCS